MVFKLNLGLHPAQQQVYNDKHRFKVIRAGRQWGKSDLVVKSASGVSLTKPDSLGMVVAPYAKQAYKDFRAIKAFIPNQYVEDVSAKWLTFSLKNKSEIMMASAENIDGMRGFTLDWAIIDEAAFCDQEVWEVLEPALGKKKGQAWFVSTPNGKGWFYDIYMRSQKDPEFQGFHFTTYDNPYFPVSEIERMRQNMPELMFRQEVMAEFLEGGIVFPHLKEISTSQYRDPVPGHNYVTGCDIAKYNDFTVIRTFDRADHHEVCFERFTNRDWGFNRTAIYSHCMRYNNSELVIDRTGAGDSVVEDLGKMIRAHETRDPVTDEFVAPRQGYLKVIPVNFSTVSKPLLYSNYIMAQQNRTIHLIPDPVSIMEHEDFIGQLSQTTKGYMQYGAPKGRHDDTVTAAALGAWGLEKIFGGSAVIGAITEDDLNLDKPKKPIDPSCQIDVDSMIRKMESRQIIGFGGDDEMNILESYDEKD